MKPLKANDLPPDFTARLIAHGLLAFFEGCTPAHQQEYLRWIGDAKKPSTRLARIEKAMAMLRKKKEDDTLKSGGNGP